jgi:hypothetical protein
MYEYKGYRYDPELVEDEDTRRYIHDVYLGKRHVGRLSKSNWCEVTFEEFKEFVESIIEHK